MSVVLCFIVSFSEHILSTTSHRSKMRESIFFWRRKGVRQNKGLLVRARVVCRDNAISSPDGGAENCQRACRSALARYRLRAALRPSGFGVFALPQDLRLAGGHAGAAIVCDENFLRGGDMVEFKENVPWWGEVSWVLARDFFVRGGAPRQ